MLIHNLHMFRLYFIVDVFSDMVFHSLLGILQLCSLSLHVQLHTSSCLIHLYPLTLLCIIASACIFMIRHHCIHYPTLPLEGADAAVSGRRANYQTRTRELSDWMQASEWVNTDLYYCIALPAGELKKKGRNEGRKVKASRTIDESIEYEEIKKIR